MKYFLITTLLFTLGASPLFGQKGKWIIGLKASQGVNSFDLGGESQIIRDLTVFPIRGAVQTASIERGERYSLGLTFGKQFLNWLRLESGLSFNNTIYAFEGSFNINTPRFSPGGDMELPLSPVFIEGKSSYHNAEIDLAMRIYPFQGRLRLFLSPYITASYYLSNTREQSILYENAWLEKEVVGEDLSSYPAICLVYAGIGGGLEFQFNSKVELAFMADIGTNLNAYRRDQDFTQEVASLGGTIKLGYRL